MKPTSTLRYEHDDSIGRIWIDTEFDGDVHSHLHTSGPKEDVEAYFYGVITKAELRRRWKMTG